MIYADANDKIWRFRDTKTEWGFTELLSLDTFKEGSKGYLVDDSCVFGVEVFVVKYDVKGESISLIDNPSSTQSYLWVPREKLSSREEVFSKEFVCGGYNW